MEVEVIVDLKKLFTVGTRRDDVELDGSTGVGRPFPQKRAIL